MCKNEELPSSNNSWDISKEREFIENLLNQRFNFFLVFFSLVVAGTIAAESQLFFKTILVLGSIICWLLALTLFRSQKKLDILLKMIFQNIPNHPAKKSDDECMNRGSRRRIIGYIIPTICCVFLSFITLLSLIGCLDKFNLVN